jgi:hypothetical protein
MRRTFSSVCTGDPRDERTKAVVPATQPELFRAPAELHMSAHAGDLCPRNADRAPSPDPRCKTAKQSGAGAPDAGTTHDRHDLELFPRAAFESKIVDVPAPAIL